MNTLSKHNKSEVNNLMPSIRMESLFFLPDWHVYHLNSEGEYINCNEASYEFLGLSEDELLYKTNFELPWRENADQWRKNDLKVMTSKRSIEFTEEMVHQNNKYICTAVKTPVFVRNKVRGVLMLIKIDSQIPLDSLPKNQKITQRELQCLYYLCKGFVLKQIAHALKISPRTVEHHINHAKTKLNCYHRSDLIKKHPNSRE